MSGCRIGWGLPKISEAMDGLREAHMDVLVAVFGRPHPIGHNASIGRLGPKPRYTAKRQKLTFPASISDTSFLSSLVYPSVRGSQA